MCVSRVCVSKVKRSIKSSQSVAEWLPLLTVRVILNHSVYQSSSCQSCQGCSVSRRSGTGSGELEITTMYAEGASSSVRSTVGMVEVNPEQIVVVLEFLEYDWLLSLSCFSMQPMCIGTKWPSDSQGKPPNPP